MAFTIKIACILLTILFALSESKRLRTHPFFAAQCIGNSRRCTKFQAKYSGSCLPRTWYWRQSFSCVKFACDWCTEWPGRYNNYPCGTYGVQRVCNKYINEEFRSPPPSPPPTSLSTPTASPSASPEANLKHPFKPNGKCAWTGERNNIVIDLGQVPLKKGWEYVVRDGKKGIIFIHSPHKGISPKGMYGQMCFNIKAPMSGKYYLTAISYAPHNTEHNDVWVKTSKGMELWQNGKKKTYVGPREWLKAYQNNGKKGMSEHFKTIDFDGHRFLVPNVVAGEVFTVCISGRSKKYELYRIILYKCEGMYCRGGIMKGEMLFNLKPSKCV